MKNATIGFIVGVFIGIITVVYIIPKTQEPPKIDYKQEWSDANIQLMVAEDIILIQRAELNEIKLNQILADTTGELK